MADEIIIRVSLDGSEIKRQAEGIKKTLTNALDVGVAASRQAQRIEAIHAQSAAKIQEIEARKQSQLDVLRERAMLKELDRQRRLTSGLDGFLRRFSSTIREAGESIQQAGFAFLGLTGAIVGVGKASVRAAVDIDRQVNILKALTGSAEQAEARFAKLVATAQKTPGLTTNLAATLDAQLRTLSVSERTIDRVLPAIGRLNAISPLGDPQRLAQNMVQLVTQNFEKQDLKELVGQSPLAGELIKQIFNVDSPLNAKAIRESAQKLGITSVESFFDAFARAAASNQKLQSVTESLGTQFEKLRDRVIVALRPLGLAIIDALRPLIEKAVPFIERLSKAFSELPDPVKQVIIVFGALAAALGPVVILFGGLIQTLGALGNIVTVIAGAGGIGAVVAALGPLSLILAAVIAAVAALGVAFTTNFGGIRDATADVVNFVQARFTDVTRSIEDNRKSLDDLGKQFQRLSEEVRPVLKLLSELFKEVFGKSLRGALLVAEAALVAFNHVLEKVIDGFRTLQILVRESASGAATVFGNLALPGLGNALGAGVRAQLTPQTPRLGANEGLDGEEITQADFSRAFEAQRRATEEAKKQKDDARKKAADSNRKRQLTELEQAIKDTEKIAAAVEALEKREGELFQKEVALAVIRLQREEFEKQRADLGFVEALKVLGKPLPLKLPNISQPRGLPATALGSPLSVGSPADLTPDTANALDASRTRTQQFDQRLRIEEIRIQNQVTTGLLSESEARRELNAVRAASRDEIIKLLEEQRNLVGAGSEAGLQFTVEIEQTRLLGVELSNTQRFMRGFNSQVDSVGDAFDRFGANVSSAFRNVRDLFNGLKSAVLGFFNDLLGQSLQNLVRNTLGGVFGNLSKSLGGIFSGAGGNVFRTPSTFGNAVQAFAGAAGGDGISVPPSISSGISQFFGASVPRTANVASGGIDDFFGASVPRTAGNTGFSFGALGKSFAAAAPAIGLGLGGGLGGQSAFGQIAGSAGGLLAGGAVAGFSGALGATATAFFTNPFTIAIGAGLLVGSFFLGKAKQRRQDEEASGQMLTSALQGIDQLAQAVGSGQISSMAEARAVFENQILGQFIQGINGLKTKSVRESRLTNQVRDLRNVFDARIPPLIAEQERKATDARRFAAIDSRLVPQFARGGTTLGGLALLHPGEKVLNFAQQASVIRQSNPQVFERAGVPGVKNPPIFDTGGTFGGGSLSPSRSPGGGTVVIDKLFISVDAEGIAIEGMSGRNGEQIVVNHIENVNLRKGRR